VTDFSAHDMSGNWTRRIGEQTKLGLSVPLTKIASKFGRQGHALCQKMDDPCAAEWILHAAEVERCNFSVGKKLWVGINNMPTVIARI
jgi:hypothetical protein